MAKHLSEVRTEDTILDLLRIQGWATERVPKGSLIRQNEYKNFPALGEVFKGKSKTGAGDAYPDFLLVNPASLLPLLVIEAKAKLEDLDKALDEAIWYASACHEAGHSTIAVGVAGQEQASVGIKVAKLVDGQWKTIAYNNHPISWIPTPGDVANLLSLSDLLDLLPIIPSPSVLADKADLINRILREAAIKDEYRPAFVGAMMLALWHSKGNIRKNPDYILGDINDACQKAFATAGKSELGKILRLPEANQKLAATSWEILATLEKLNVVTAVFDHDYLGQLYETFFRYTGGNTIGQYFTPRQITRFMVDLCEVSKTDKVIDPACGTGGFLVAVIQRAFDVEHARYEDVVEMVRHNLVGYDSEPLTAALCVANMILRGDGKSGIANEDVFHASKFPTGECNVALMNPPFPHKATDVPPQQFVEKALEALDTRGKLAVILPSSMVVKKNFGAWRQSVLAKNTLRAVIELPDETFQPFASATTCVLLIEKGIPHSRTNATSFVRIQYDGLVLKKGVRVPRSDDKNQLDAAVAAVLNKEVIPGFAGKAVVAAQAEWFPGAYIPAGGIEEGDLKLAIDELMRRHASFYTRYAHEIVRQRVLVEAGDLNPKNYRDLLSKKRLDNAKKLPAIPGTIGEYFDIFYGQKELHSRDGIPPGESLIISPTEQYNGTYGWLTFKTLIKPAFVTVAQTGSIGESFVQTEPCGVNDDCLILLPKKEKSISEAMLFIAAAIIRLEKWRFSYGRKLTPSRIAEYRFDVSPSLEAWATTRAVQWKTITEQSLQPYLADVAAMAQ
ncbi:MAG: N-6 DNA methylase [Azonexus sp.]|nr:N-6 DNA methylase [Azonexus sp.]MCK6413715.1 N-6 DNA methylase [Azonexus sp.]